MKTKLTLFIMAVCLQLWSQGITAKPGILYLSDTVYSMLSYHIDSISAPIPKYDTIPVVMLISDTAEMYYVNIKFTNGEIIDGQYVDYFKKDTTWTGGRNYLSYWMFGFKVLRYYNYEDYVLYDQYYLEAYLDEKGNSLSEGIIVWDSRKRRK